jgi:hypothetical protein
MTAHKKATKAGLSGLDEMASICDVKKRTLQNWYNASPKRFDVVLAGCVAVKQESEK